MNSAVHAIIVPTQSVGMEEAMTTLDKSIPYYPVLMVLTQPPVITDIPLAKGYSFHPYEPSYKEAWIALHVSLGQLESMESGRRYFAETFETHPKELAQHMILVVDENGNLAGTSSVWEGFHFGERRMRVHWVGVDERHQRKGLAKSLMLKTIQLYSSLHCEHPLYLTTQTNSYVAISMYQRLGFTAYRGSMPVNFHANADTFAQDNETAWRIIEEQLHKL